MAKFVFELEDVLKIRNHEKDLAQAELGKAVAEENRIQGLLDALAMQYNTVKQQTKDSTESQTILSAYRFYQGVKLQQEKLFDDMAKAKIVTEAKRKVFNEAYQKVESLEKLKEQKQLEFNKEQDRLEEEEMEDIFISAASWKTRKKGK
ncbi:MAG: flagellar export protein FliJ [Treponema sp.]|nr:flagellar export protein FliJ [Treponema sp.]